MLLIDHTKVRHTYPLSASFLHVCIHVIHEFFIHIPELDLDEVRACISWMRPFYQVVEETGYPPLSRPSSTSEDMSNYQIHSVDLMLLDRAHREAEIEAEAKIEVEEPALMIF